MAHPGHNDEGPRAPIHRKVSLRRPPADMIELEDRVDPARAAQLVNSGVLTAEISAANTHPDFEV